jgi:hypothetical protein
MRRCGFGKGAIVPGLTLVATAFAANLAGAQAPAQTRTFDDGRFRFAIALPEGCRHDEGPGTVDAVCSADFDPEKSAKATAAASLLLAVAAEPVPEDAGKTLGELQERFGGAAFRDELPETVCGESDKARVKIADVKEVVEETQVVFTAEVVCREVRFLQIGERRALVRHVITPEVRYRLLARTSAEDFEAQRETIGAFLAGFRVLPPANAR